jgi:putative FmdB family regulatory protein
LPLYEYKCVKCGHRFEKIEGLSASALKKCPRCGAKAERQLSAPAIQFKGSGWYVTDYAGKKADAASSEKSANGDSSKVTEKSGDLKSTDPAKSPDAAKSSDAGKSSEKATGKKKK